MQILRKPFLLAGVAIVGIILFLSFIIFSYSQLSGDPRYLCSESANEFMSQKDWDALGKEWALDEMFPVRYIVWVGNIFEGTWYWDLYPITSGCIGPRS